MNAMLINANKIDPVFEQQEEFFFQYDKKHKWSICEVNSDVVLSLYAKNDGSLEDVMRSRLFGSVPNTVSYSANDQATKEAWESFQELLNFVKEKALGVTEVLDDIIADLDDDIPF